MQVEVTRSIPMTNMRERNARLGAYLCCIVGALAPAASPQTRADRTVALAEDLREQVAALEREYRAELRGFRETSQEFGDLKSKARELESRAKAEVKDIYERLRSLPHDKRNKYGKLLCIEADLISYAQVRQHVTQHRIMPQPSDFVMFPLHSAEHERVVKAFLAQLDEKTEPWAAEAVRLKADPTLDGKLKERVLRAAETQAEARVNGFEMKMLRPPELADLDGEIRSLNLRLYGLGAISLKREKGGAAKRGSRPPATAKAEERLPSSPSATPKPGDVMREGELAPVMVFIQGATFGFGFDPHKWCVAHAKETPARPTTVASFWIGKYEVTASEFCHFLNDVTGLTDKGGRIEATEDRRTYAWVNERHSPIVRDGERYVPRKDCGGLPVNQISWYGAAAYCRWLSKKTGAHYRLPTEAEWDFAAYGVERRQYPWGAAPLKIDGRQGEHRVNHNHSWVRLSHSLKPVHEYERGKTPEGLHHMIGNVAEWCADNHFPPYPQGDLFRPATRGGSWLSSSLRGSPTNPEFALSYVGLRVARSTSPRTNAADWRTPELGITSFKGEFRVGKVKAQYGMGFMRLCDVIFIRPWFGKLSVKLTFTEVRGIGPEFHANLAVVLYDRNGGHVASRVLPLSRKHVTPNGPDSTTARRKHASATTSVEFYSKVPINKVATFDVTLTKYRLR